ncbi:hypothetical protein HanIR_Chr03g0114991 [Helianthus annuus]|nr:hypothetical protein HanIR_Chr03g0114991 [Helianthus annuus]
MPYLRCRHRFDRLRYLIHSGATIALLRLIINLCFDDVGSRHSGRGRNVP